MSITNVQHFADRLIVWQRQAGRHNLPWQNTRDIYHVWVSEVMLQQTQVVTVIDYYQRFMTHFPTVEALANASEEAVFAQWAGLGYYSRARNLHRAARQVVGEWGGHFPDSAEGLAMLPGIGKSTAAAVASFCFSERVAILDANVKRVIARHAGIEGVASQRSVELRLWEEATLRLPVESAAMPVYTQGMMDLGATICTPRRPNCVHCPVAEDCIARQLGRTELLPTPRPRKVTPERSIHVLLIVLQDHVLLEYRNRAGVWKGLWSLPEADVTLEVEALCETVKIWGLSVAVLERAPMFHHVFSHYRLALQPWVVHVSNAVLPSLSTAPEGYAWKPIAELATLGLPAPIRRHLDAWFAL